MQQELLNRALQSIRSGDVAFVHFDERSFIPLLDQSNIGFEVTHYPAPYSSDRQSPRYSLRFTSITEVGEAVAVELVFNWAYHLHSITPK